MTTDAKKTPATPTSGPASTGTTSPATTRSKSSAELTHLVGICLTNKPANSGLELALAEEQVTTVVDLLGLPTSVVESLEYLKDGTIEKVPSWAARCLVMLKSFISYKISEGDKDYLSFTFDIYADYVATSYNADAPHTAPASRTRSSAPTPSKPSTTFVRPPAEEFKKSIKRDKTHYKPFKEDKEWDSWSRSTRATARSHDCDVILNSKYRPRTQEEKDLFEEKQKFMYSVFDD